MCIFLYCPPFSSNHRDPEIHTAFTMKAEPDTLKLKTGRLALKAPIATKVVCFSRLLKYLRSLYDKQCGPRSDCSHRSYIEQSDLGPPCLLLYLN